MTANKITIIVILHALSFYVVFEIRRRGFGESMWSVGSFPLMPSKLACYCYSLQNCLPHRYRWLDAVLVLFWIPPFWNCLSRLVKQGRQAPFSKTCNCDLIHIKTQIDSYLKIVAFILQHFLQLDTAQYSAILPDSDDISCIYARASQLAAWGPNAAHQSSLPGSH